MYHNPLDPRILHKIRKPRILQSNTIEFKRELYIMKSHFPLQDHMHMIQNFITHTPRQKYQNQMKQIFKHQESI